MIKKTVTYTDFNGERVTEDLYFHLSSAELIEMEADEKGSMAARLKGIVGSKNNSEILKAFQDIVLRAYGHRSEDGKRFIKSDEIREELRHSPAFDEVLLEIMLDPDKASEFINAVIPQNLSERIGQVSARSSELGERAAEALTQGSEVAQPTPEQVAEYIRAQERVQRQSGNAFGG